MPAIDWPVRFVDRQPAYDAADVVFVGAGACGPITALTAQEAGVGELVLGRDSVPAGSTSRSSGMIPACGTHFQATAGVEDSVARFAGDIMAKNCGAARGVSGAHVRGYLSGNGLLTAAALGRVAGREAARLAQTARSD